MADRKIGIIVNGATGRMARVRHLQWALQPLIAEGGVVLDNGDRLIPDITLVARNKTRLARLAADLGVQKWTTDLSQALSDSLMHIYFDAAVTAGREDRLRQAIEAGKHVYTEKPLAGSLSAATALRKLAETSGVRHGIVADKIFLPGMLKLKSLIEGGFFGRLLSARIDFGWWIFDGSDQPSQRASWNYKKAEGGGLVLDMFPHWNYMLEYLFAPVVDVYCQTRTHIPKRWDEKGVAYEVDVEDSAYGLINLENQMTVQLLTSWASRVFRHDLMEMKVDGTKGSAVATLHDCWTQSLADTPKPAWDIIKNPNVDHFKEWTAVEQPTPFVHSFRPGWEAFLRHVADDAPFEFTFDQGVRAMAFINAAYKSAQTGKKVSLS